MELYRLKRDKLAADPELFTAFVAILEADPTVVEHHLQALYSILKAILIRGVESGEFQIADLSLANDEPTADLLTQRMQLHEKNAWMLRSLLEA